MTRRTATNLALEKVLRERLKGGKNTLDDTARAEMLPGDRLGVALPDGERIASVTLADGRANPKVTDHDKLLAWVQENHPDEVETVTTTRVRPAYEKKLTDQARKLGAAYDEDSGEQIPGVTVEYGDPYPKVDLTEDAHEKVAQAWRDSNLGEMVADLLQPALPPADENGGAGS